MIKNPETVKLVLDELEKTVGRKILYIDMDGVIADFVTEAESQAKILRIETKEFLDRNLYRTPGFYSALKPFPDAIAAVRKLMLTYDVILVSAPSWGCPSSFSEKRVWIEEYFGKEMKKRMDLSFHKGHYMGHYLIDDRIKYGAVDFMGEHIMYGNDRFPDWKSVLNYLL